MHAASLSPILLLLPDCSGRLHCHTLATVTSGQQGGGWPELWLQQAEGDEYYDRYFNG